jgi:hypothetical protein
MSKIVKGLVFAMKKRTIKEFSHIDQLYDTSCVTLINELFESFDVEKGFLYQRNVKASSILC